ncbi:cAMP-responsive element modulator isoform X2 [Myripristis murdjan]|uniref:cAMP-responsive element modulator isoform X2 n=1 Tax=Myripristis murdjan TaxID=586833 RepID=UPI00117624A3|nr:cAMP-responsive element modulator-like isoform X2 [Myripristis murdjan]
MDTSVSSQPESGLVDSVTDGEEKCGEASPPPAALPQVSVGSSMATESSAVTVVQLSDDQTVQVHGVIQAPQTSVIQSPQVQTVQIATVAELDDDESVTDSQKRREILSRRPSYRKILNELSSDSPAVPRIEEEKTEDEAPVSSVASAPVPTSVYQTSSGQYIAITQGGAIQLASPGGEALPGGHTLTMAGSAPPQPGATILQCAAQPGDSPQQFYIQGGQVLIQDLRTELPAVVNDIVLFTPILQLSSGTDFQVLPHTEKTNLS